MATAPGKPRWRFAGETTQRVIADAMGKAALDKSLGSRRGET
jgi:hypothetical protein